MTPQERLVWLISFAKMHSYEFDFDVFEFKYVPPKLDE